MKNRAREALAEMHDKIERARRKLADDAEPADHLPQPALERRDIDTPLFECHVREKLRGYGGVVVVNDIEHLKGPRRFGHGGLGQALEKIGDTGERADDNQKRSSKRENLL